MTRTNRTAAFGVTVALATAVGAFLLPRPALAVPVTLYAAGSLNAALTEVAADFTAATGTPVVTHFGPSGVLRQQIEGGAHADVFASADLGNPQQLHQEGRSGPVATFATNRVVAVVAGGLAVTPSTLAATLLDPSIKLGTSTPIADPLGDYTEQLFAKIDAADPGAKAILDAKAQRLVGGPNSPPVPAGQNALVYYIDVTHQVDVFLSYETSALAAQAIDPTLQIVPLPADLAIDAPYGLTVLDDAVAGSQALADFILSAEGQAVLARFGFGPAASVPEPAMGWAMLAGVLALGVARARPQPRRG